MRHNFFQRLRRRLQVLLRLAGNGVIVWVVMGLQFCMHVLFWVSWSFQILIRPHWHVNILNSSHLTSCWRGNSVVNYFGSRWLKHWNRVSSALVGNVQIRLSVLSLSDSSNFVNCFRSWLLNRPNAWTCICATVINGTSHGSLQNFILSRGTSILPQILWGILFMQNMGCFLCWLGLFLGWLRSFQNLRVFNCCFIRAIVSNIWTLGWLLLGLG